MKVLNFFKASLTTDLNSNVEFINFVNNLSKTNNTKYVKYKVSNDKLYLFSDENELVVLFKDNDFELISTCLIHSI